MGGIICCSFREDELNGLLDEDDANYHRTQTLFNEYNDLVYDSYSDIIKDDDRLYDSDDLVSSI